jgi:hypothetical protein
MIYIFSQMVNFVVNLANIYIKICSLTKFMIFTNLVYCGTVLRLFRNILPLSVQLHYTLHLGYICRILLIFISSDGTRTFCRKTLCRKTFCRKTFCRTDVLPTDVLPNGHFAERTVCRTDNLPKIEIYLYFRQVVC